MADAFTHTAVPDLRKAPAPILLDGLLYGSDHQEATLMPPRKFRLEPYRMYRAPWDNRLTTFLCAGNVAYELQIGPLVVMRYYEGERRWKVWRDLAWRWR